MVDESRGDNRTAELARLLREGRKAKGWTLREAAAETGISNGYLSLIENGEIRAPSPRYLLVLAERYGVSYESLMTLAGHPFGQSVASRIEDAPTDRDALPATATPTEGDRRWRYSDSTLGPNYGAARPHTPEIGETEREQLAEGLLDDLSELSEVDVAQVRAFIAGLRAGRRS